MSPWHSLRYDDSPPTPAELESLRRSIGAVYDELGSALEEIGPTCSLSGRCCRFEEYGHTLFLSRDEAELLLADAPPPARPLDEGSHCPWQDGSGRCTARRARPLGCRIYHCDPNFAPHAGPLTERFLDRLKQLSDERGRDWAYAPLHVHLRAARAAGRFADPPPSGLPPGAGGQE